MRRARKKFVLPDEAVNVVSGEHPGIDPDTSRLLFALRAVAQSVNDRANEWLAPLQLNVGKYNYLVALRAAPGRALTLKGLGDMIHTKSATVTQMVASLQRDGLVACGRNPEDRRSIMVKLTPSGRALIRKAMDRHHQHIEALLAPLSVARRRALYALLIELGDCFSR